MGKGLKRTAIHPGEVLADEFSLRERGIKAGSLIPDVKSAQLDVVLDQMEQGRKVLWH